MGIDIKELFNNGWCKHI